MRYWDAFAVVLLLVRQARIRELERLLGEDPAVVTWWGTQLECYSALMRLVRDGQLDAAGAHAAERRLQALGEGFDEVLPGDACRQTATRMLRVHPLRAADALQLAAAMVAADHNPERLDFVCLDRRLAEAARKEGFPLPV
jgi:uncharacterized protein